MPVIQQDIAEVIIEGFGAVPFTHGFRAEKQTVSFQAKGWQALGGAAAFSLAATKYLLKQGEELAKNPDLQPVFIQWDATAMPNPALNASDLHDGWYYIDSFEPDYQNYVVTGMVDVHMTVTEVAAAPPKRMALAYSGGALSSNFSGAATSFLTFPKNASVFEGGGYTRNGAEGALHCISAPLISPETFIPSGTVADWFKGGVHVYDTISGGNAVPTSGGVIVNANWVEVFSPDHDFVGSCIVTNGLLLFNIQPGKFGQPSATLTQAETSAGPKTCRWAGLERKRHPSRSPTPPRPPTQGLLLVASSGDAMNSA